MNKPSSQESSTQPVKVKHANLSADSALRLKDTKLTNKLLGQTDISNSLTIPPGSYPDASSLTSTADDEDIIIIEPKKKIQTTNGDINMLINDLNEASTQKLERRNSIRKDQSESNIITEINTKEEHPSKDLKAAQIDSGSKNKGDHESKKNKKEPFIIDLEDIEDIKPSSFSGLKAPQPQTVQDPILAGGMPNSQELLMKYAMSQQYNPMNPLLMSQYSMLNDPRALYGGYYGYNPLYDPTVQMQMGYQSSLLMNQLAMNNMVKNYYSMMNPYAVAAARENYSQLQQQMLDKKAMNLTVKDPILVDPKSLTTIDQATLSTNLTENSELQPGFIWNSMSKKVPESANSNENSRNTADLSFSKKGRTASELNNNKDEIHEQKYSRKLKNKMHLWDNNKEKKDDQVSELSDKDSKSLSKLDLKKKPSPTNLKFGRSLRARNNFELTPKMKPLKRERKMNRLQLNKGITLESNTPVDIEKNYEIKVHQDDTNDDEIINTRIGQKYQAEMVTFLVNEEVTRPKKNFKLVWSPEKLGPEDFEKFMAELETSLGEEITNQESAIKQLKKFNMECGKLFENVKKNQKYYKNQFSGNSYQSILRLRNSGNNLNS